MSNPVEKHYCEVDLNITTFFNFLFLKLLAKKMRITMDGGQMFKKVKRMKDILLWKHSAHASF